MEDLQDIVKSAMDERFELAFKEMKAASAEVREAVKRQRDASIAVHTHPSCDKELKQIVETYFDATQLLHGEFTRYLYMQGAKDCAAVLRELGMIK